MNISYSDKRVNPLKIFTTFSSSNLTPYGGMILFGKFFEKLKLKEWIKEKIQIKKKRRSGYTSDNLFLELLALILAGLERISHAEVFKTDEVFRDILGLPKLASYVTLWRFLRKFNLRIIVKIRDLQEVLLAYLCKVKKFYEWILDIDFSVYTVYGKHEGAQRAFNPKRKGALSYYPVFCSIANLRYILHARFRGGKTPSTQEIIGFLRICIKKAERYVKRIKLRLDAQCYRREVVEFLEKKGCPYTIVAHITRGIQMKLPGLNYKNIGDDFEVASFYFQPLNWGKEYKFVVRRKKLPEKETKQGTLFVLDSYTYRVLITNMDEFDKDIWRFYDKHADVENVIKEDKEQFRLHKMPSTKYLVNLTYFWIVILAHNLFILFKQLCMPRGMETISMETMRLKYIVLAAKLIRTGRELILQFSKLYPHKEEFIAIEKNIYGLSPP